MTLFQKRVRIQLLIMKNSKLVSSSSTKKTASTTRNETFTNSKGPAANYNTSRGRVHARENGNLSLYEAFLRASCKLYLSIFGSFPTTLKIAFWASFGDTINSSISLSVGPNSVIGKVPSQIVTVTEKERKDHNIDSSRPAVLPVDLTLFLSFPSFLFFDLDGRPVGSPIFSYLRKAF